jgi:hypothetical protein
MGEVIRDEDLRARVRLAQEFLDPGTPESIAASSMLTCAQTMSRSEATGQTFW